jgi:N-acetylglucosamine-6-phosphate deacetylase
MEDIMILQSKRVWATTGFYPLQIELNNGKITNIYDYNTKDVDEDYGTKRILPGFIDMHCHGAYGFDTNYAQEEGLINWLKNIPSEGVTSLCPTTITESKEVLLKAVKNIKKVYDLKPHGADILGIHFEGPYLDMKFKGAQPPEYIAEAIVEEFKEYQEASGNLIKVITLACEHDPDFKLTEYCSKTGVVVSQGHSGATIEEARLAVLHGAKSMTHIFNGMSRFSHRDNNLVGAAMRFKNTYGEVICDGNHSTPEALNILINSKGYQKVIMITDSLMAKGSPAGTKFIFGGHEIEVYPDGSAHLTDGNQSLAGSTLKVNEGLRILVEKAQIPFYQAIDLCTVNPATLLKVDDHKAKIMVGYDGDIVVLEDDYSVKSTYCLGVKMYEAK